MKRANPKGYGAPYIKVWGPDGEVITDSIDHFQYKYLEDSSDEAHFTFKTNNRYIRDKKMFQGDARWKVQWGYLKSPEFPEGLNSKIRTVYVRELKTTYDDKNITIKVTCTDGAAYMSQIDPRGNLFQNVTFGQVVNTFAGQLGLTVMYDTDVFIDGNGQLQIKAYRKEEFTEKIKYANFLNKIRAVGKNSSDATHAGGEVTPLAPLKLDQLPNEFVLYEDMFMGNSMWQTLKKMVAQENIPGMILTGRDDNLYLSQRNLNKKPIHTYEYDPSVDGELLMFSPEEKRYKKSKGTNFAIQIHDKLNKKTKVQYANTSDIAENRKIEQLAAINPNIVSQEQLDYYKALIPQIEKGLKQRINISKEAYDRITKSVNTILEGCQIWLNFTPLDRMGRQLGIGGLKNRMDVVANEPAEFSQFSGYYEAYIEILGNTQQTRTGVNKQEEDRSLTQEIVGKKKGSGFSSSSASVDNTSVNTVRGEIIPLRRFISGGTNDDQLKLKALNALEKAEFDVNPAEFKAIGQPEMEAQNVLIINKVAKRDAGRYWIKNLTHTISKSEGYIMTGELTRNSRGSTGDDLDNVSSASIDPNMLVQPEVPTDESDFGNDGQSIDTNYQ